MKMDIRKSILSSNQVKHIKRKQHLSLKTPMLFFIGYELWE